MPFQLLVEKYNFEIKDDYLAIETDFEIILINTTTPERYSTEGTNLIRFITEEFEEDYTCKNNTIHAVYFIPSHKEREFCNYLDEELFVDEMGKYYTEEMRETFNPITNYNEKVIIKHKDRSTYGSSFYGVDEVVTLDVLINTAKEILKLNAMRNHRIAIGSIAENNGLLEKSGKIKTSNPQSRHYNFWKFHERLTGVSFFHVAQNFKIIS